MSQKFEFLYEYTDQLQPSLIAGEPPLKIRNYIQGHLIAKSEIYGDKILCGKGWPDDGTHEELGKTRRKNIPICKECERIFKEMPGSPWKEWVEGKEINNVVE